MNIMYEIVTVRELFIETVFVNLAFQFPMSIQLLRVVCQYSEQNRLT